MSQEGKQASPSKVGKIIQRRKFYRQAMKRLLISVLLVVLAVATSAASGNKASRLERRQGSEISIERPASRAATAFVPRLGKRDQPAPVGSLEQRLLCASSAECSRWAMLSAVMRSLQNQEAKGNHLSPSLARLLFTGGEPVGRSEAELELDQSMEPLWSR